MAQTIQLKRSSVAGNVPGSSDLALGEIAINTADGAVYIKKGNSDIVAVADNDILHIDTSNSRVGINKASPNYRLDVGGNIHSTAAYIDGYIYHTGDTDTYINYSADNVIISAGGEVMHIKGSGRVGIGTSSPSEKLSVAPDTDVSAEIGKAHIGSVGHSDYAGFAHVDKNTTSDYALLQGAAGDTFLNASSGQRIKFRIGNSEKATFDSAGRLLINTSTSIDNNALLHIMGNSSGHAGITMQDQDNTNAKTFFKQTGGATEIQTQNNTAHGVFKVTGWNGSASAEFMRVAGTTGHVGINTTSPNGRLSIHDDSGGNNPNATNTNLYLQDDNALAINNGGSIVFSGIYTTGGSHLGYGPYIKAYKTNATNNDYSFGLKFATRENGVGSQVVGLNITHDQKVGIGANVTPDTRLEVKGGSSENTTIRVSTDGTATPDPRIQLYRNSGAYGEVRYNPGGNVGGESGLVYTDFRDDTSSKHIWQTRGAEKMRLNSVGNLGIGTTSPQQLLTVGTLETSSIMTHGTVGIKTASDNKAINIQENSGAEGWGFGVDVNGNLNFYDSSSTTPSVQFIDNGGVKFNNAYTFPTSDGSANQVLQTDGSGNLSFATVSGGGGSTDSITDADGDTKIQVEESTDEDKIRFDVAGSQLMQIASNGVGINEQSIDALLHLSHGTLPNIKFERPGTKKFAMGITGTDFRIDGTNDNLSTPSFTINTSGEATFGSNVSTLGGVTVGDSSADVLRFVGSLKQGSGSGTTVITSSRTLESLALSTYGGVNLPTVTSTTGTYFVGSNTSSIINHPMSGEVWHDIFAHRRAGTWTYETSTDGSNFSSATIHENPFDHKDTTGVNILTSTVKAARWIVSGLQYATIKYFSIAAQYVASGISVKFKVETSSDGSSWTTRVAETTFNPNTYHHFFRTSGDHGGNGYIRVTLTKDDLSSTTNVEICRLCAWSNRPGDQGLGKENQLPFDYVHRTSVDFRDNQKLRLGGGNDLELYHNATDSKLENYTGDLYITNEAQDKDVILSTDNGSGSITAYVTLDGSDERTIFSKHTRHNDSVAAYFGTGNDFNIYHNGSHSYMDHIGTGNLYIRNNTNDSDISFQSDDGSGGMTEYFRVDGSSVMTLVSKPIKLFDSVELYAGTDNDMRFTHDGTNGSIDNYTGDLLFRNNANDKDVIFQTDNGSGGLAEYIRLDGSLADGTSTFVRLPDNGNLGFGASNDLRIYHDTSHSYINNFTGNLEIRNDANDGDINFRSDNGSGGLTTYFAIDGGDVVNRFYKDAYFTDSVKAKFGSSSDLQIYHDGSNSYITEGGTGDLLIQSNNSIRLRATSGENIIQGIADGAVTLYHDNSSRLLTASDGVILTSTDSSNLAGPVLDFNRDSSSPADADYLGQLKFRGENDADQDVVYAKITAKAADVSDGTEDGAIEFTVKKAGSNNINARLSSTNLDLINGTGLSVAGNATITGNLTVNGSTTTISTATLDVEDNNITLNKGSGDTSSTANGAGITIQDAVNSSTDATILWDATNDEFDLSHSLKVAGSVGVTNIVTNKVVKFNGSILDDSNITDTGSLVTLGSNSQVSGNLTVTGSIVAGSTSGAHTQLLNSGSIELCRTAGSADPFIDFKDSASDDYDVRLQMDDNKFIVKTGGAGSIVTAATFDATGNLGIGTTSPSTTLNVSKALSGDASQFEITNGAGAALRMGITGSGANEAAHIKTHSGEDLEFHMGQAANSATPRVIFKSDGNVGIGTASPSELLEVAGDTKVTNLGVNAGAQDYLSSLSARLVVGGNAVINTNSPILYLRANGTSNDSDLRFQNGLKFTNGSAAVRAVIASSGNVGIGTTSPGSKLTVEGDIRQTTGDLLYSGGGNWDIKHLADDQNIVFYTSQSGSATEKMRIKADGKIGVNTSAPGALFTVNSSSTIGFSNLANAYILAGTTSNGIGIDSNEIVIKGDHMYFGTADAKDIVFRTAGANERMKIASNGNVSIGAPSDVNGKLHVNGNFRVGPYYSGNDRDGFLMIPHGTDTRLQSNNERFHIENNQGNIVITATGVVQIGTYAVDTTNTGTTATTQVAIHSFAAATFRSARFTVQVTNSTDSTYHTTELLLVHDGTTANITEFGEIHTGSAVEATFDADISSGNVRLLATPASTDTMAFKVVCHSITT